MSGNVRQALVRRVHERSRAVLCIGLVDVYQLAGGKDDRALC